MNSNTRQSLYMLFILLLFFVSAWLDWMSIFEMFVIMCFVGIIVKLTDIEDVLGDVRWKK